MAVGASVDGKRGVGIVDADAHAWSFVDGKDLPAIDAVCMPTKIRLAPAVVAESDVTYALIAPGKQRWSMLPTGLLTYVGPSGRDFVFVRGRRKNARFKLVDRE